MRTKMINPRARAGVGLLGGALLGLAVLAGVATAEELKEIHGAGATFPYPVYAKWADAYNKETGVKLNYQSIGSGGGIKQFYPLFH